MPTIYYYDGQGKMTATLNAKDLPEGHPNATSVAPNPNLLSPVWTGSEWVAGATAKLSKVAFMDFSYPHLGGGFAGISRYGEILSQAKANTSPLVVAAMERYTHASVFERGDVATFLDILVADTGVDVTQAERDAIVSGWPENDAA